MRNDHAATPAGYLADHGSRVQALDRGLAILDILADADRPMGVSDIASVLRVSLPTASRLAATLRQRGLLHQEVRGGRYSLGLGLVRFARGALDSHPLELASADVLVGLLAELDDTISLAVPSGAGVLYVRSLSPPDRIFSISFPAGKLLPYHSTATGKVLLAFGSSERVEDLIAHGLARRTRHTITDSGTLRQALARVRECGYAVDSGEGDVNVGCVAVPVHARGEVTAALGCSLARAELSPQRVEQIVEALVAAAEAIEAALTRSTAQGRANGAQSGPYARKHLEGTS
ncbi:MAG: IclR family transcriptional regulator [Gemmatimonadaceae bacterium]